VRLRGIWLVATASCVCIFATSKPPSSAKQPFPVRVPIWFASPDREHPQKLSANDLAISERGRKLVPDFLLGPDSDLFLLVALDLTGDVAWATDAKNALAEEIGKLPPRAYVSALNCGDEMKVLEEPTLNRARTVAAIQSIEVTGKSGLLHCIEGVESVADAMLAKSAVRVGVVLVSDAVVQNYREDLINPVLNSSDANDLSRRFPEQLVQNAMAALERRMEPSLAPLYVVQLNTQTDRWNEAYYDGLKLLTQNTMAEAFFCASRAAVADSITSVFERLRGHYSARVAVPASSDSVEIEIESAKEDGPRLIYRSRFTMKPK
jgi:hypothetical protein